MINKLHSLWNFLFQYNEIQIISNAFKVLSNQVSLCQEMSPAALTPTSLLAPPTHNHGCIKFGHITLAIIMEEINRLIAVFPSSFSHPACLLHDKMLQVFFLFLFKVPLNFSCKHLWLPRLLGTFFSGKIRNRLKRFLGGKKYVFTRFSYLWQLC